MLQAHRLRFFIATVALFGGSAISLAYPQAARYAVDQGLVEESLEHLNLIVVVLLQNRFPNALSLGIIFTQYSTVIATI